MTPPAPPEPDDAQVAQRRAENAAAEQRAASARNPRQRILSGAVGGLLFLAALVGDAACQQGWFFAVVMALCSVLALREVFHLAQYRGARPFARLAYVLAPLYILALEARLLWGAPVHGPLAGVDPSGLVLVAAGVLPCLGLLFRQRQEGALVDVAVTWLGLVYVAGFASCYLRIRHLGLPGPGAPGWVADGMEFVVVTVFVTKMADIGALLVGRRFGRHKLIPRLSPGKTWEGAVGGLLAAMGFMAVLAALDPDFALRRAGGWPAVCAVSAMLAVVGTCGDLVESAFKRDNAAKDAGASIPGFGGILDLIDSLLLAGPVMYVALLCCGAR